MRKNTRALRFTALLLPFVLMACDDPVGVAVQDDPDPVDEVIGPVDVSPQLDTSRRVAEVIDVDGGSVSATAADGTTFTLTIPAETFATATEIAMTPVSAIPDLPSAAGLLTAVQFEPDGLELFPAAILEITLPPGVAPDSVGAFGYEAEGRALEGALAIRSADVVRFVVPHFSGVGLARISASGSLEGPSVANFFEVFDVGLQTVEQFANTAVILYEDNVGEIADLFEEKGLTMTSDLALKLLGEYGTWKELVFHESGFDVLALLTFEPLVASLEEGERIAAALLRALIERSQQDCTIRESLADANRVLELQKVAEWIGVDKLEERLDLETVLLELCVHIAFEEVTFPQQPLLDTEETLRVVVGHSYGGPTLFTEDVSVSVVDEAGVTIPDPVVDALVDAAGALETTVIPSGGNIEILVGACLLPRLFPRLDRVCQDAFVLRGLVLSPATTTIAPGETQQFTADMLGVPLTEGLVWTAEGGSITQEGFFVAGSELGTFTITAGSIDDPTIIGTARVTISGESAIDKIVFRSFRDVGSGEIYVMSSDGSDPVRLTNDPRRNLWPSLSPDGRRIAFGSARDGNERIFVMDADGANPHGLTSDALTSWYPRWSPDGMKISYTSEGVGGIDVFSMDANGSNPRNLTNGSGADALGAWSPDGSKIGFVSDRDGNWEIYEMNADGSNPRRLTNNPSLDYAPSWSPDGRKIAFWSDRDGNREIYVMDADGSNQVNLTNDPGMDNYPSWSPDGTQIVFESRRDGNPEIYVMDADGSNLRRLTNNDVVDEQPFWGLSRAAPSGAR